MDFNLVIMPQIGYINTKILRSPSSNLIGVNRMGNGIRAMRSTSANITVIHNAKFNVTPTTEIAITCVVVPKSSESRNFIISKRDVSVANFSGGFMLALEADGSLIFTLDENTGLSTGRRDLLTTATGIFKPDYIYHIEFSKTTSYGSATPYSLKVGGETVAFNYTPGTTGPLQSGTVTVNTKPVTILYEKQPSIGLYQSSDMIAYDLKLWSKDLTSDEARVDMLSDGSKIADSSFDYLTEWWRFDSKSGNIAKGERGSNGAVTGYDTENGPTNQWVDKWGNPINEILPEATIFYISNSGSGSGASEASPMPPSSISSIALVGNYILKFKRGETFEVGEIQIAGSYVKVEDYGLESDPVPIITGGESLSGATWTDEGSGIYSTVLSETPKWAFIAGVAGKYAQSNFIEITARPAGDKLRGNLSTLNGFNTVQSLVGAKVRIKEWLYRISYEYTIIAYDSSTGTITVDSAINGGDVGFPFIIYGQKQFITENGEWWFETGTNKLYIKAASAPTNASYTPYSYPFTISNNLKAIEFRNLEIKNYYKAGIEARKCADLVIEDCKFHDIRQEAIFSWDNAQNQTFRNNEIYNCGYNAITIGAIRNSLIENNYIHDIGMGGNYPWPLDRLRTKVCGTAVSFSWDDQYVVVENATPKNVIVRNNLMHDFSYNGMVVVGDEHDIYQNIIHDCLKRFTDGAAIHTFHRPYSSSYIGYGISTNAVKIRSNIVYNIFGSTEGVGGFPDNYAVGVYLDAGSTDTTVEDNVIFDVQAKGIFLNIYGRDSIIQRNLIMNAAESQIAIHQHTEGAFSPDLTYNTGNIVRDNILVCKDTTQVGIEVANQNGLTDYNPFSNGGDSNNNIFVAPYGTVVGSYNSTISGGSPAPTLHSLAGWQTRFGTDSASSKIPNYLEYVNEATADTEIFLDYNDTEDDVPVTFPAGRMDVYEDDIASVDLAPYEGIVTLIKNIYVLRDFFNGTNGTAINSSRSPNVGPLPTVAGTHAITSNRMSTSVAGRVSWDLASPDLTLEFKSRVSSVTDGMQTMVRVASATSTTDRLSMTITNAGGIVLTEQQGGVTTNSWSVAQSVVANTDYTVKIVCLGTNVKVYVNTVLKLNVTVARLTGNWYAIQGTTPRLTDFIQAYPS